MKKYRLGIIGYGGFGRFIHEACKATADLHVVAVADMLAREPDLAEGIYFTTDWRDIARDPGVDLVIIVTEPSTHEELAKGFLEAGKAVLVEKPLAQNKEAARQIVDARDSTKGIIGIDLIMRFNPLIREIKRLTEAGVFGALRRVVVENYAQDESLPGWFWDKERSGGILVEHAVHFIDLVHFIAPDSVSKVTRLLHERTPGMEDQVMVNILYDSGLMATHYHSFARPGFFEKQTYAWPTISPISNFSAGSR